MNNYPTYRVTFTGRTPLLMHADNIDGREAVQRWQKDQANRSLTKPGDDRTPPWTWKTYLYSDGETIGMPADNILVCLRQAGAKMKLKGNTTFKALTQTGLMVVEPHWPLHINGNRRLAASEIEAITGDFDEQLEAVRKLGFTLLVQRKAVQRSKHIRVRPRFQSWQISGTIQVLDEAWKAGNLRELMQVAGFYIGFCDERPGGKTPGTYGRSEAEVVQL